MLHSQTCLTLWHSWWYRVQWKLTGIQKQGDGTFSLSYDTPDGAKTLRARSVALTVPAYVAADLLEQQVGIINFRTPRSLVSADGCTACRPLKTRKHTLSDLTGAWCLPGRVEVLSTFDCPSVNHALVRKTAAHPGCAVLLAVA